MYGNSLECKFINYLCNFALSNHGVPTFSHCIFLLVFRMITQKEIDQNFISFNAMKAMKIFYVGNSTYHNFCISKENTPLVFLLSHFLISNVLSCFRKIYCQQKDYDILYVLYFIGFLRLVLIRIYGLFVFLYVYNRI